jgi:hypothetical protein
MILLGHGSIINACSYDKALQTQIAKIDINNKKNNNSPAGNKGLLSAGQRGFS